MHDGEMYFWIQIWNANNLGNRGILLGPFLQNPDGILRALIFRSAWPDRGDEEFYPLLPAQRAVAERLRRQEQAEAENDYWRQMLESFQNDTAFPPMRYSNGRFVVPINSPPVRKKRPFLRPWKTPWRIVS